MIERVKKIIERKGSNSSQFAEEIGVQRSSISHILSGRNKPSLDFILKILEHFPDIDTNWLLFGKGQMLKEYDLFSNVNETKETSESHDLNKPKELLNKDMSTNENEKQPLMEGNEEKQKDFIDIISKTLFNSDTKESSSQEKSSPDTKKEEDINTPSLKHTIERVIIFYQDGKFKEYKPL
jgi:transcriptional regulator with XRE-family HTH domain